jgi:hypothetical protein
MFCDPNLTKNFPQGLKASGVLLLRGTDKSVPFQNATLSATWSGVLHMEDAAV